MRPAAAPRPGLRAGALCAAVLMLTAGMFLVGQRAWALWVDVPELGEPGYLTLASDPYPADFPDLSPGDVIHWQIRVDLNDDDADVTMQLAREGALVQQAGGLLISATACSVEWDLTSAPVCLGTRSPLLDATDAADTALGPMVSAGANFPASSPVWDVGWLDSGASAFVLVTLTVPDNLESRTNTDLMGLESSINLAFTASGADSPAPHLDPPLVEPPGRVPTERVPTGPGAPAAPTPGSPDSPSTAAPPTLAITGSDMAALTLIAVGAMWLGGLALRRDRGQA